MFIPLCTRFHKISQIIIMLLTALNFLHLILQSAGSRGANACRGQLLVRAKIVPTTNRTHSDTKRLIPRSIYSFFVRIDKWPDMLKSCHIHISPYHYATFFSYLFLFTTFLSLSLPVQLQHVRDDVYQITYSPVSREQRAMFSLSEKHLYYIPFASHIMW
jgi:hypothetical protein